MLLCYITDRKQFASDNATCRRLLLDKIAEAACSDVNYIQLREKDLPDRELESLAQDAMQRIQAENPRTALLINSRTDVALAVSASGVHLRSDDISPEEVRKIWQKCVERPCGADTPVREQPASPVIGVSCHTADEVAQAASSGATFAVFGPVFEKAGIFGTSPTGLDALRQACQHKIPVLALGGITLENAQSCIEAGAAGIAGIRLFQENDITKVVRRLKTT